MQRASYQGKDVPKIATIRLDKITDLLPLAHLQYSRSFKMYQVY